LSDKEYVKVPWARFIAMGAFILSVAIATFIEWPMGPFNLTWGALLLGFAGYIVLLSTTFIYIWVNERRND
jgi:hypothetical protein